MLANPRPSRRKALLWIALGIVTLAVLAAGLGTFDFQPGKNFQLPAADSAIQGSSGGGLAGGELIMALMRGVFALALLALPLFVVVSLFSRQGRQRLLYYLVIIGILFLVMNQVQNIPRAPRPTPTPEVVNGAVSLQPPPEAGEALPEPPPAPSDALVTGVSIALVLAILAFLAWFGRRLLFHELPPLVQIANEADKARRDLASGGSVEDVVVRCYRQMSRAVAEAREIRRDKATTPREFEAVLAQSGLPAAPLQALTRLFEDVRYGGLTPGPAERQAAIASLEAIAAACRIEAEKKKKKELERARA